MEALTLPPYPQIESTARLNYEPIRQVNNQPLYTPINSQASIETAINTLFPTQEEENKIARTRGHLGETAKDLSDAQVETIISEFQFLIDSWMDEYEQEVFGGKTLREILNGG